ncbi:acetyl-CoA synthetase-like protein [Flammula alnicola]|nr:acetyl-CoA synthetase-like protein [Flammula alnicola]
MSMTVKTRVYPPMHNNLTLLSTLAFHEKQNADLSVFVFSRDGMQDITEVSYRQFARACRRVPQALGVDLPLNPSTRPVVALIAHTDTLLYHTIKIGIMIAGLIPFPISPRNTPAAVVNLLKKTSCHHLFATCTTLNELMVNIGNELKTTDPDYELIIKEIPTLSQLYPEFSNDSRNEEKEFLAEYPEGERNPGPDDVAFYLHSSGSTGLPKAIRKTHRQLIDFVSFPIFSAFRNQTTHARMAGMHLPPFHAMGIAMQVSLPLYLGVTVALFPPVVQNDRMVPISPTPDNILSHIERTQSTCVLAIPAFLQTWVQDKRSTDTLSRLDFVGFGGGALSPQIGSLLWKSGVKLRCMYGGTEFGAFGSSSPRKGDEEDWEYMEFNEKCNIRWMPQGDGTYELQFLTSDVHRLSIENLPDAKGYATSDLFRPHPTKNYLWKIVGRVDDVIIHSSGEKTVPTPMEDIIMSSPQINGVVMFGHAHDQPGVLIEPTAPYEIDAEDMEQVARFRNLVWPVIDNANNIAPAFSKIFKEMIVVTGRTKPLVRAGKGTVLRKASLNLYTKEIEALFATVESVQATELIDPPRAWDREGVTQWILDQARDLSPGRTIIASETLFEQGFDSLSATMLRRRITGALQSIKSNTGTAALHAITQNTVYNYPTVNALSARILELLADPNSTRASKSQVENIEQMIRKYSFNDDVVRNSGGRKGNSVVVLITGSTGYLGSQVLEGLLRDSRIAKVYALNRPSTDASSVAERHLKRFRDKGLDEELLKSPKLVYLESDYSENNLGLLQSVYAQLSESVNVIIHIAWRLDFNLSLASFESNIRGTYNLAQLARSGAHAPDMKFIFTSSVGAAQSWDQAAGPYPEELVLDAKYAVGSGYGESKYILATSGLNTTSLRVGQITGSHTSGAWATSDWVPILVKSSLGLGALPTADGNITWIPTNSVSDCLMDLVFYAERYPPALNIVHPNPVPWNATIKHIREALELERNTSLPLISFQEWFTILGKRGASSNSDDLVKIPAIKLHDFFQGLYNGDQTISSKDAEAFGSTEFATQKVKGISKTLAELPPLTPEHAHRWLKYWNNAGFFDD